MTDNDNQQTIEVLEELFEKFTSWGYHNSANAIQNKIDKLTPKHPYIVGAAYAINLPGKFVREHALYLGENRWALLQEGWWAGSTRVVTCDPDVATPLVDPTRPEIVSTSAELASLPTNTIVRRRDDEDITYDVAVVNQHGRWYRDSTELGMTSFQMASEGSWEVVSRG